MRMKMGNKILWLMSCLLFCGQVVWGEKLTLQEAIQLAQASSPEAEAARHTYGVTVRFGQTTCLR